jgi:hypothetical protein
MYWYEVPLFIGEEGGLFPLLGGVALLVPPGGVFHVLKVSPATGLLGCPQELPLGASWVALTVDEAKAVFATYYGGQPSAREVYAQPPAPDNSPGGI